MSEKYEALEHIQKLAQERYELYLLAGNGKLSDEQRQRLNRINGELPGLWDEHRREVAAMRNSNNRQRSLSFSQSRPAA